MRVLLLVILFQLVFSNVKAYEGIQKYNVKVKEVILKAASYNANTKVTEPINLNLNKATLANFEVTYNGFSTQAQTAFQHAVDIWASIITSPVPIRVHANWDSLGPQVLGSASAATFLRSDSLPKSNTWYPVALSEKLFGANVDEYSPPDSADIKANFNSNFTQWYFGTDGQCPAGRYDFVTVVLHELCHGLGFQGSMDISNGQGSWGFGSGYPFIYDHFTEDGSGRSLINTSIFPNPSSALATILTGGNVYFNGSAATTANGFSPVRLYAPGTWDPSSSYSHLNETTYPAGHINSLMTPTLSSAEVIHHPGDITLGMFEDMGWTTNVVLDRAFVYSGDTDNNGTVNALDILPIGVYFLTQGAQRQVESFFWGAQESIIWADSLATYVDANGDGTVDEKDVIGIGVNWGKTHSGNLPKPGFNYNDPELLKPYKNNFKQIYNSLSGSSEEILQMKQLLNNLFGFEEDLQPVTFNLEQNYPNPFNPSTNIGFSLAEDQIVNLIVYNTRGETVAKVITNQPYSSGLHSIKFDAAALSNGVYIYMLITEKFNQSQKMVVLK